VKHILAVALLVLGNAVDGAWAQEAPQPEPNAGAGEDEGAGAGADAGQGVEGDADASPGKGKGKGKGKKGKKGEKGEKGEKGGEGKGEKKEKAPKIEIGGRVFVRSTLSRDDREAETGEEVLHDLSVASARIQGDYRVGKRLKMSLEVDFAGNHASLKDVYLRARLSRHADLYAGRFKKPISPIALESAWRLPEVERGLLSDVHPRSSLELPFGGRGDGAAVVLESGDLEVTAALFQHAMDDGGLVDVSEAFALDPYLRVRIEPARELRFGATAALVTYRTRPDLIDSSVISNAPLGSVDAEVERGPVKLWLEGFAAKSTVYGDTGEADGTMAGARALVAVRVDRPAGWLERLEPWLGASAFDPILDDKGDHGLQGSGGLALTFTQHLRLQIEAEVTRIRDPDRLQRSSRAVLYTQLGAAF